MWAFRPASARSVRSLSTSGRDPSLAARQEPGGSGLDLVDRSANAKQQAAFLCRRIAWADFATA
jgi:hypothetical protein